MAAKMSRPLSIVTSPAMRCDAQYTTSVYPPPNILPFCLSVSPKLWWDSLKSVNSNFTLAVRSRKFGQAKTHFLSHHNVCFINRFANFPKHDQLLICWSWVLNPAVIFFYFFSPTWDKKWVLACPNFRERTVRVKLELTDFRLKNFLKLLDISFQNDQH